MSAQPGAKHVYTVIALSSAGVPSVLLASNRRMKELTTAAEQTF
jgi:hypothetical protein